MTSILDEIAMNGAIPSPTQTLMAEEKYSAFSRTLANVPPLVPEDQDPNVLFKNNWLSRGQGITLTASSGVGKSSMTMQTAFYWTLGREWLAKPIRPMKCAIIQAEDSERDVAEQIEGMKIGLCGGEKKNGDYVTGCGWREEEFDKALKSILCPTCFVGKVGDDFIRMLKEFQCDTKCDMIFINPVQAFFGGDVSDQREVSHWTRAGIDPIIKGEGHACGIFLVTHTAKFTSGDKQGRANVDDYGEYIGAGSHEWTDWTRAKFTFLKKSKNGVYFDFKASKRGGRLGWTDDDDNRTTNKVFKHSDGFIFWEEVTDPGEIERINTPQDKPAPVSEEEATAIAERMVEWIRNNRAVTKTELSEKGDAFAGLDLTRRQLRAGGSVIKNRFADYHMQYSRSGYGFTEGLRVLDKIRQQQEEIDRINRENEERKREEEKAKAAAEAKAKELPEGEMRF